MENVKKKKLKKPMRVLFAIILLILWYCFGKFILFRTTNIEKTSFTSEEVSVIASELSLSSDKINISKMRYTHARESCFVIYAYSDSKSILDPAYEYANRSYFDVGNGNSEDVEVYRLKQKIDYYCYVTLDNKQFCFVTHDYNKSLMDIMEKE